MEHESFENPQIAAIMNEHFVNIKVDREERPDIDQIYMTFVQMTTGSGGWPMTVFLTPDKEPFFGGTYFPPEDRYGRPGFTRVLLSISEYYHKERDKLDKSLQQVSAAFREQLQQAGAEELPDRRDWHNALDTLERYYEPTYGGIGQAPKFPAAQVMQLFLRQQRHDSSPNWMRMVTHTLTQMARGGIYDQLGGGFHRYSVDEKWLVPHFEKMLYDQGQLAGLYVEAWQATGEPFYLDVARDIVDFVLREMNDEQGGFYSSLDADSEGEEGKFYVWSKQEVMEVLGDEAGKIFCARYDITEGGNFEGHNIPHVTVDPDDLSRRFDMSEGEIIQTLKESRSRLLQEREKRVRPGLDDKVITSWNGLMLSGLARVQQAAPDERYEKAIRKNIEFVHDALADGDGLLRTWREGEAKQSAFIEDYAFWIAGLLDAYEALFEASFVAKAIELCGYADTHFYDDSGSYYMTSDSQEELYQRMRDETDESIPAGTGVMLMNHLRLYAYTEDAAHLKKAEAILKRYAQRLENNPYAHASYLNGLDFFLDKALEVVLVQPVDKDMSEWLALLNQRYLPNRVLSLLQEGKAPKALSASLFEGRKAKDGQVTAFVCRNFECSLPVTELDDLQKLLSEKTGKD